MLFRECDIYSLVSMIYVLVTTDGSLTQVPD